MATATAPAEPTTTAAATPPTNRAIGLRAAADGRVAVATADAGKFAHVLRRAADVCRLGIPADAFPDRFAREVLLPIRQWCEQRADRVAACFLPPPAEYLRAFLLGAGPRYDYHLGSELSDLEARLFDTGWLVSLGQVPVPVADSDRLRAYFDPDQAVTIYAHQQPTPGQGPL